MFAKWFGKKAQSRMQRAAARRPRNLQLEGLEDRAVPTGDTLALAGATGITGIGTFTLVSAIGDEATGTKDVDLFVFQGSANDRVTVETDTAGVGKTDFDTMLRLFDSTGKQLSINDDGGNGTYSLITSFVLPATGTYYVGVSGFSNSGYDPNVAASGFSGATGDYTITLDVTPPPSPDTLSSATDTFIFGSGSYSTTAALGDEATGSKDVDIYSLFGSIGNNLTVETSSTGGTDANTFIRVFDSKGTELIVDNDSGTGSFSKISSFSLPASDTYYIAVSGAPNSAYNPTVTASGVAGSTGSYALDVNVVVPPPTAGDTLVTARSTGIFGEGTYNFISAIGDETSGSKDVDLFRFDSTAGYKIRLSTDTALGTDFDSFLRVFDSTGKQLSADNDSGNGSYSQILNFVLPADGTYYIGISGNPNKTYSPTTASSGVAGATGDYTFNLSVAAIQDVFLQGKFVEVGINMAGSFGTTGVAPAGYHALGIPSGGVKGQLGFVADPGRDGWNVGTPPQTGDYFIPDTPEEGWALEWTSPGGKEQTFGNFGLMGVLDITPLSLTETSVDNTRSAVWVGVASGPTGEQLRVTQTVRFNANDLFFVMNVVFENIGTVTLGSVEYMRNVDADQEEPITDSNTTDNWVTYQPSGTDKRALAVSRGTDFGLTLGLGTIDSRARVSNEGFE